MAHRGAGKHTLTIQSNVLVTVLLLLLSFLWGMGSSNGNPGLSGGTGSPAVTGPGSKGDSWSWEIAGDPTSLEGKTIIIDPGHGGANLGTRGVGPTPEKTNVLAIAYDLKGMLEYDGARVILTRTGDYIPGNGKVDQLAARTQLANNTKADIYVSIHNDWNKDSSVTGTTSYFYSPDSYKLAVAIQRALVAELRSRDHGVQWANYYVLRHTAMPATLLEVGFLSNKKEAWLLSQGWYRTKAARGIYNGIVQYFSHYR